MTIAIANPAQHRLESQVFEAVSLWLDEGTHRAYQAVVHAVSRLMGFFPDTSEMFFEKAGTCTNPEVMDFLTLVKAVAVDFPNS